jgi:hypothetical protein
MVNGIGGCDRSFSRPPLAAAGAGGAWPAYLGALPPGPAPQEGDWFTQLRERWLVPTPTDAIDSSTDREHR